MILSCDCRKINITHTFYMYLYDMICTVINCVQLSKIFCVYSLLKSTNYGFTIYKQWYWFMIVCLFSFNASTRYSFTIKLIRARHRPKMSISSLPIVVAARSSCNITTLIDNACHFEQVASCYF